MYFFYYDEENSEAIIEHNEQVFENIKHINDDGQEYWLARELQPVLEYAQWRRFSEAVERAKLACKNSGFAVEDHFADVGKMVDIGSGAERQIDDIMLSRYACYVPFILIRRKYISFYNSSRPHRYNNYKSPDSTEKLFEKSMLSAYLP